MCVTLFFYGDLYSNSTFWTFCSFSRVHFFLPFDYCCTLEEVKEEPQKSPYGESSLSAELLSYSSPASLLSMTTYNANSGSGRRNNIFSDELVYQKIIEYKRNLVRDYSPLYSSLYPLNSLIITCSELLLERFLWNKAIKGLWRAYKTFEWNFLNVSPLNP